MPCCGLLQLIAYDVQDIYLTSNGNYIHKFRIYYEKHIIEDIMIKIEINTS